MPKNLPFPIIAKGRRGYFLYYYTYFNLYFNLLKPSFEKFSRHPHPPGMTFA